MTSYGWACEVCDSFHPQHLHQVIINYLKWSFPNRNGSHPYHEAWCFSCSQSQISHLPWKTMTANTTNLATLTLNTCLNSSWFTLKFTVIHFLSKGAIKIILHYYSFCIMELFISLFYSLWLHPFVQIFLVCSKNYMYTFTHVPLFFWILVTWVVSLYLHELVLKIKLVEDIWFFANYFDFFVLCPESSN